MELYSIFFIILFILINYKLIKKIKSSSQRIAKITKLESNYPILNHVLFGKQKKNIMSLRKILLDLVSTK